MLFVVAFVFIYFVCLKSKDLTSVIYLTKVQRSVHRPTLFRK